MSPEADRLETLERMLAAFEGRGHGLRGKTAAKRDQRGGGGTADE